MFHFLTSQGRRLPLRGLDPRGTWGSCRFYPTIQAVTLYIIESISSPLPPPTGLASFLKAPHPRPKLFAYHPGQCQGQEQRVAIVTEPAPSTKSRTWSMLRRIFGRKDYRKTRPSQSLLSLSFPELFPGPPLPRPGLHPSAGRLPGSFPASPGPALPRRPAPKAAGVWRQPWFFCPADGGN